MYELIHKPTFTNQLLGLQPRFVTQVLGKVELLREDPRPHGDLKKKLHGYDGGVYRLRSGDFRIVYSYGDGWVVLLGVDDRKDVYRGNRLVADRPGFDLAMVPDIELTPPPRDSAVDMVPRADPEPPTGGARAQATAIAINEPLLKRLRIPTEFHGPLLACRSLDDLIDAAVPEETRNQVFDLVSMPDFDQVLSQPSYVTGDVSDLLRFAEGELLGFLLQLDPEQERLVDWALNGTGPTLVKGGPGTGKSTIALHRVRSLVGSLRQAGTEPHVLFTTYTNALVAGSRQQLARILGADADLVDVRTADSVAAELLDGHPEGRREIADRGALRAILDDAIALGAGGRTPVQKRLMSGALDAVGQDYLLDEIEGVIEAREITTLDAYLVAQRAGRLLPLHAMQRRAIWQVSEVLTAQLAEANLTTWARRRRRAAELARQGVGKRYDAVVVDEAQDLQPTSLRLLMALCPQANRFFLTADANQSIYGGSFRWAEVHQDLRFRGRTALLRRNYRSTREIGEAATSYLGTGVLDDESHVSLTYVHSGPRPAIRRVVGGEAEADLLSRFLAGASRELHLGLGSCAVLVPTEESGRRLADRLGRRSVRATFMPGRQLDLESPAVKVVTLKSAKGLEFPIVAVAGFHEGDLQSAPPGATAEEHQEILEQERRTMFVAFTRAMRALLVALPESKHGPLLHEFRAPAWNTGEIT